VQNLKKLFDYFFAIFHSKTGRLNSPALAVYLVEHQRLPLARACEVMEDLMGVTMSEGTLCALVARCAENLGEGEEHVKAALQQAEITHQDETSVHVAKRRHGMHVTSIPQLTHSSVNASPGRTVLEAIGSMPHVTGTSVHDGWGSYFLSRCQHAVCTVPILRELTALAEEQGLWWAAKRKAVLLDMKEATELARNEEKHWLHLLDVADWHARVLALLDRLRPTGCAARCATSSI